MTSVLIGLVLAGTSQLAFAEDLLEMYQLALKNDPKVIKAEAQFKASQEGIVQARAALLPNINFSGTYSDSNSESSQFTGTSFVTTDGSTTNLSTRLSLSMDLYNHRSWLGLDTSKKRAHQSDISLQTAKQDLIVRVTQAYFDVLKAKDDVEFALAEKAAIARQLEQTKQRHEVGLIAITDVHEAQAKFDNAIANEIQAQNGVYNAEEALREITNTYPEDLKSLNTDYFSVSKPKPDTADQWQQMAETKNLNLINQKIAVDIAKEAIDSAQAGHYPTLGLNANYNTRDSETNGSFVNDSGVVVPFSTNPPRLADDSISVTLNVPIYQGGATESKVREAQHNYVAASQDLESTHRSVVRNARNSFNTLITNVSSIKALEQSVISAESALKATESGAEVGIRTIVDVLDSTRNLYNAKRNLSSTRYSYITNMLNLKLAAGTISEADIEGINKGLK